MAMERDKFVRHMQRYAALWAITGSTFRNQRASGIVAIGQRFLTNLDLKKLSDLNKDDYAGWLKKQTEKLTVELKERRPRDAKGWGLARKGINVFMVHVSLNRILDEEYKLRRLVEVFEIPLDSYTSAALRNLDTKKTLPVWPRLKKLTEAVNAEYQKFAAQVAREKGLPRPYLDVLFWRANG